MNEESLSALLDGECSPSELAAALAALERDSALRERFSRQVLARDIAHGVRVRAANPEFADRVMAALDRESGPVADVIPLARRSSRRVPALVALAAAAAVAAAAVLVFKPGEQAAPVGAPQTAAGPGAEALAAAELAASPMDETDAQLRNYVLTYSQSRAQHGVGGSLGYARYAAYTGQRPGPDGER